jgi:hypothetical protein
MIILYIFFTITFFHFIKKYKFNSFYNPESLYQANIDYMSFNLED